MALPAGTRVGVYDVIELVGAGGMGEVYRALDTRLKRDVALKVLPASLAAEPDRLLRFAREAEMLAALNHPNIAAIYGVEDADGVRALVMELVEGETLADHIARSPLAVTEALAVARQIALALESAHEQGIIHRDLKPANIKLRDDGTVKVLDFGLAKLTDPIGAASGGSSLSLSPTITSPALTNAGMLLGTAAYMSPEQAKGRPADKRSDLWAFGCVLFEMLTGKRAFEGEDVSETLASVLRSDPDWTALPADTPPAVRTLIRRCLEKDRRKRVADSAAVLFALDEHPNLTADAPPPDHSALRRELDAAVGAVEERARRRLLAAAAVGIVAVAAAAATTWWVMRPLSLPVKRVVVASSVFPVNQGGHRFAISRSGSHVAYIDGRSGASRLYVRAMDRLEPTPLASPAAQPFFSPGGDWIGYLDPIDLTLKRVSIHGPPVVAVVKLGATFRGATWIDDDTIVVGDSGGLQRVSVSRGTSTALPLQLPDDAPKGPHLMPAGIAGSKTVVFTIGSSAGLTGGTPTIATLDLTTNAVTPVLTGGSDAQYVSSGHLVYTAGGSLWAVRFDPERSQRLGTPVPVVPEVTVSAGGVVASYAVSAEGTLLYTAGDTGARQRAIVWVDRDGRETPLKPLENRAYLYPRLSDDDTRVAVDIREQQNDIWILHLASMALEKFTTSPLQDRSPVWAGDRLLYGSDQDGRSKVVWQPLDRKRPPVVLTAPADANRFPLSVTPDGRQMILWQVAGSDETSDLLLADLPPNDSAGAALPAVNPKPLVVDQTGAINGIVSPNGSWLAYEANDTGNWEIYVRRFPDGGVVPVSTGGGRQPLWSRTGDELFYLGPTGMMSVRIRAGAEWSPETPRQLFPTAGYYLGESGRPLRGYDVSRDGSRFLMLRPVGEAHAADEETDIIAVENWFEELKRLVGK